MAEERKKWCTGFGGSKIAEGFALTSAGRGLILGSNVYLLTTILYLASGEAGCLDEEGTIVEDCDKKVHGFQPSSLLTNIGVVTGLTAGVLNPFMGAIIDFTDHRYALGCIVSIAIVTIQGAQIYTVRSTWFIMAIMQSVVGFLYEVFLMASYAYLPELSDKVEGEKISDFSSKFTISQAIFQALQLIIVLAISIALEADNVATAQISQSVLVVLLVVILGLAWCRYLPKVKAKRELKEGKSLFTEALSQLCTTIRFINKNFKNSLRPYLLAVVFSEAAATSLFVIALTIMKEMVKLNTKETAIAYLIVLIAAIPGSKFSGFVATKMSLKNSWRVNLMFNIVATAVGSFALTSRMNTYIFSAIWGVALSWHIGVQTAIFAVLMPQEQAAEMSGLFGFCSICLTWFPSLMGTIMNERGISMRFVCLHLILYYLVAFLNLSCMSDWEDCVAEVRSSMDRLESGEGEADPYQTEVMAS